MSLAYPLAKDAEDALSGAGQAARTRYDAEGLAGETPVLSLETEWFKPEEETLQALLKQAESGEAKGFIQTYEDADGKPVLAVTYWKLGKTPKKKTSKPAPPPVKPKARAAQKKKTEADHTDDLYFRHGRTRKSRRRKYVDPRQMDLFMSPDQRGYERSDPNNPNTMLTDEEGDGTTFGG